MHARHPSPSALHSHHSNNKSLNSKNQKRTLVQDRLPAGCRQPTFCCCLALPGRAACRCTCRCWALWSGEEFWPHSPRSQALLEDRKGKPGWIARAGSGSARVGEDEAGVGVPVGSRPDQDGLGNVSSGSGSTSPCFNSSSLRFVLPPWGRKVALIVVEASFKKKSEDRLNQLYCRRKLLVEMIKITWIVVGLKIRG